MLKVAPIANTSMKTLDKPPFKIKSRKIGGGTVLKLADIIYIASPENEIFDNNTFFIEYIDNKSLKLVDITTLKQYKLRINNDGTIGDGTIQEIIIVERDSRDGYARQNELIPGKWINIYFDGDTPAVLIGEITNLEKDMIEITSYPDNTVLYIDFGYKGVPDNLNIKTIELRQPPAESKNQDIESLEESQQQSQDEGDDDDAQNTQDEDQYNELTQQEPDEELNFDDDENKNIDTDAPSVRPKAKKIIQKYIIRADERQLGPVLDAVTMLQSKSSENERFDIQMQTDDLLDDLVMKASKSGTTPLSINEIKREVERFVQLRHKHSHLDEYGNVTKFKKHTSQWRPLVESLELLDTELKWILPVVKNVRRLEIDNLDEDMNTDVDVSEEIKDSVANAVNTYMKGGNGELINHYKRYVDTISREFQPSIDPNSEDREILATIYATLDIMTIVDNLGNFRSTNIKNGSIGESRMCFYRNISPANFLEPRGLNMSKIERTDIKPSNVKDIISIKSFVSLPYPMVKFSKIDLPATNIAIKSAYNDLYSLYHKSLTRKTKLNRIVIDKLQMGSVYNVGTFETFNNFMLSVSEDKLQELSPQEIYRKYLEIIVPKTRNIIDTVSKYATHALNFHDYVDVLEPYLLYKEDLTFSHYKTISGLIENNISQYISTYKKRLKDFTKLKTLTKSSYYNGDVITKMVDKDLREHVFEKYNQQNNNYSNSEFLSRIIQIDGGRLLYDAVTIKNLDNLIHKDIHIVIQQLHADEMKEESKDSQQEDKCQTVIMSKQYFSPEEITADNEIDVYYDKKYDTTDYSMLIKSDEPHSNTIEKFSNEHSRMTPEDFFQFIRKKVATKLPNNDPDLDYITENIIRGKKRVRDGDYAMFYDSDEEAMLYYKRVNNIWKVDNTIDKDVNFKNSASYCNTQPDCVAVSTEGDPKCVEKSVSKTDIRRGILKQLVESFDHRYNLTKEELADYIKAKYRYDYEVIDKLKVRRVKELCKYDAEHFKMGLRVDSFKDVIRSEQKDVLNEILAQSDLNKKYSDLLYFVNNYTEEHTNQEMENSDPKAWRYCSTTKTPLVPIFLVSLASAWCDDGEDYDKSNYRRVLDKVIRESGKESEDGGYWVDKNSGEVITKKMYDDSEGYDDMGRKNVSREVVEEDFESKYMNKMKNQDSLKKFYSSPETRIMYDVTIALSNVMSIGILPMLDFIISLASSTLQKPGILPSEKEYKEKANNAAKSGKKMPKYDYVYNQTILYLTLGAFLIGVQTYIPGVVTKKTYPGCVKSFKGYPFDKSGDTSGLEYLSCVVQKSASPSGVWKVLQRKNKDAIQKIIVTFIDNYYIENIDVKQKIREKIEYLMKNPQDVIPDEMKIVKWTTFLPPQGELNIKVENIKEEYRKLLISDIKSGSPKQWERLAVIHSKIQYFSLYVQQGVQEVIQKEHNNEFNGIAETTASSKELFMDSKNKSQIEHFGSKECEIKTSVEVVRILEKITKDVSKLSKANMLYCSSDSKNVYAPLRKDFSEETIYRAFIDICKFTRVGNPPDEFLSICGDKPEQFDKADIISEKIRKLKQQGKSYDSSMLERLLQLSGMRYKVRVEDSSNTETQVTKLMKILEEIEQESPFWKLRQYLEIVLDSFDVEKVGDSVNEEIRGLRNYLGEENQRMIQDIVKELDDHISILPKEKKRVKTFLDTMTEWNYQEDDTSKMRNAYYNCFDFIKKYIVSISRVFPQMILNTCKHTNVWFNKESFEKRMNVSKNAADEITENNHSYYKNLEVFYNNQVLKNILEKVTDSCDMILRFAEYTPYFSSIDTDKGTITSVFDKKTCGALFQYYLLNVLTKYIDLASDSNMLNMNDNQSYGAEELERRTDLNVPEVDPSLLESDLMILKTDTCRLLFSFIDIMQKHRDDIDVTYFQVSDINFKVRETEKQIITSRLEALTDEERDLDTIKKINKLGVWNAGLQKSLKVHVKESYDAERDFTEKMKQAERAIRKQHSKSNEEDVTDLLDEYLEQQDAYQREEDEENDLSNYYGEDGSDDPYGMEMNDEDRSDFI
tara:strand:- start:4219 stop:10341 length:6123 start_codon:yes stop_codon:yes gene_type:complete